MRAATVERMEWSADVSAGDWIRESLAREAWGESIHTVIPRGFPAYARILHPPQVSWVEGGTIPTDDELREMPMERWPVVSSAPTTWAAAAAAFGTTLHPTAQWGPLVGHHGSDAGGWQHTPAPDGRRYDAPEAGRLDPGILAGVMQILARGTTTPDELSIALWEGSGGLVGFYGSTSAVIELRSDGGGDDAEYHRSMLERSIHDPFNNVFRKPVWQPGILSDEVSRGTRLELPGRDHVLFRGSARELSSPDWAEHAPWSARDAAWTESPSLVWPADHAWILATEVDFDSTIVGADVDVIAALCARSDWEALPLAEGADLGWQGDEVNR